MEYCAKMISDIFNQAATDSRQIALWRPVLGVIIVFIGMNMRVEIRIQKNDEEDD